MSVEIEVVCECGNYLAAGVTNHGEIEVETCESCSEGKRKEGYDTGYDEGHDAGYDDGYSQGQEDASNEAS